MLPYASASSALCFIAGLAACSSPSSGPAEPALPARPAIEDTAGRDAQAAGADKGEPVGRDAEREIASESIEALNRGIEILVGAAGTEGAERREARQLAVQAFTEAIEIDPANHMAWYELGQVHTGLRNWPEAIEALTAAVKLKPNDPMFHLRLGIAQYESGNTTAAMATLERAVKLQPFLARGHFYLGKGYGDLEQPARAARSWTDACQTDASFGPAYVHLARLYLTWDYVDHAEKVLVAGVRQVRQPEWRAEVLYYAGLVFSEKKKWPEAIAAYSESLEITGDDPTTRFMRGLAYRAIGDEAKARADLEGVITGTSTSPAIRQQANHVLFDMTGK